MDSLYRDSMEHSLELRMGIKGSDMLTLWTTT